MMQAAKNIMDDATLVSLSLDDIESYESVNKLFIQPSLARKLSLLSVSSSDSTDTLLPQPVASSIGTETLHARTRTMLKRLASYMRRSPGVAVSLLDVVDPVIVLFFGIIPTLFGFIILGGYEPYNSADGGIWAASAAGGAILGLVSGILVGTVGFHTETRDCNVWLAIVGLVILTGVSGQALGVIMLPAGKSGGLDVVHALEAICHDELHQTS
ncbi:hypothetical protein IEO21_07175 [Rhodonia placenta]|uniref:Uncharacterized protein n=1 Tax=Rhodonia placenta TaxID=104341 RepID=A0A8H7NYI7_9APHY|nr:hypothetical protein IEO21_07175 [Postia placenta]